MQIELSFKFLSHPQYSPNLKRCDFYLFSDVKKKLKNFLVAMLRQSLRLRIILKQRPNHNSNMTSMETMLHKANVEKFSFDKKRVFLLSEKNKRYSHVSYKYRAFFCYKFTTFYIALLG